MNESKTGTMAWCDLTVPNAEHVRDFYSSVIGWKPNAVSMGDYDDFSMQTPSGQDVAGICHAKGANADMPAQWLLYFLVEDLDAAIGQVEAKGGKLCTAVKSMGGSKYVVIQDPSGAVCVLYQQ